MYNAGGNSLMEKTRINWLAIRSIRPDGEFGIDETYSTLTWFDWNKEEKPTKKEFDDAVTAWETDYDAQEYARNRVEDYPDWGAQFNKIYDDGLTKWKSEMVDPVKTKWPKDNSGPV